VTEALLHLEIAHLEIANPFETGASDSPEVIIMESKKRNIEIDIDSKNFKISCSRPQDV
jgi:hypothetical protein